MDRSLRYVECPRDSWQGFSRAIPTEQKRAYLRALTAAGFRWLDLGSFVSPAVVPQLADTEEVLAGLSRPPGTEFLCIVANERGLARALAVPGLSAVGYPLSVNETFQWRNTRRTLAASWELVAWLQREARAAGKGMVVYLSMGFGNPYGEPWVPADTAGAVGRLRELGVSDIALADTVGTAGPDRLRAVLGALGTDAAGLGLHLHARPGRWRDQLEVALAHGLSWFEGALGGIGGCPFADDELVGNLPTEEVLPWLAERGFDPGVSMEALVELSSRARELQAAYG
ncbi:MAG TPA: hydroxymethylglutaryl-CoA lyase [Trueperaceae bacterium]